jgi:hypothetical protein
VETYASLTIKGENVGVIFRPPFLEKEIQKFINDSKSEISEFKTENVPKVKTDQIRYFCITIGRRNRTMVAASNPSAPYKRRWLAACWKPTFSSYHIPPPTFPHPIREA